MLGPVVDTCYEIEFDAGEWQVVSYITYANGRRIRNWVAGYPTQPEAYITLNRMRAAQ